MTTTESIRQALNQLSSTSLRFRPKSSEPIDNGLSITEMYEALSPNERLAVREELAPSLGPKLLALSGFMAEAAINNGDVLWLRAAIVLHLVEDFGKDYRENFRYLVLVAYAAERIGADITNIINSVLPMASVRSEGYLRDFSSRSRELNKLASFGIREELIGNHSKFVPI
ncbi:MAG: hypothetical protein V4566_04935 [Pseudomonadota bacterium]|jgi:hypothetical protein